MRFQRIALFAKTNIQMHSKSSGRELHWRREALPRYLGSQTAFVSDEF
jgi:hypothetical protein